MALTIFIDNFLFRFYLNHSLMGITCQISNLAAPTPALCAFSPETVLDSF